MSIVTYTPAGPWSNGNPPGISAAILTAIEAFLAAGWFDSLITSNGSGVETLVGLIAGGSGISCAGPMALSVPSAAQTLATGNTIVITQPVTKVTNAGAVTGIIMTAGTVTGQLILLYNRSTSGSVTFAASSSNTRMGSATVLAAGCCCLAMWDGTAWTFVGAP
jgi:ABC-type uncharacterized transport system ATPase component